jgi:hypothetical protein
VIGGKSGKGNLGLSKGLSNFSLSSVISAAISLWEIFIQLSDLLYVLNVVFCTCDRTDGFVLVLLL